MGIIIFGLVFGLFMLVYLVPTFIAMDNRHPDLNKIALLNFFTGWTLIGWIIALVWALKNAKTK